MDGVDLFAKEWYKQKLDSVGRLLSDDPYVESNSYRFRDVQVNKSKPTTPDVPRRSPIQVLIRPDAA